MREINIVNGETVFTKPEPPDDLLLRRLEKSVKASCKHPNRAYHSAGIAPDTGEWYWVYACEDCGDEWTCWDDPYAGKL